MGLEWCWMDRGRACAETRPQFQPGAGSSGVLQQEVGSWWDIEKLLILRRPPSGRLEARTSVVQPQASDADGMVGSAAGARWCAAAGARRSWRSVVFRPLRGRVLALVPRRRHQLPALSRVAVDAREGRRM